MLILNGTCTLVLGGPKSLEISYTDSHLSILSDRIQCTCKVIVHASVYVCVCKGLGTVVLVITVTSLQEVLGFNLMWPLRVECSCIT